MLHLDQIVLAQEKTPIYDRKGVFLDMNLGIGTPVGQLSDRFGIHQTIGAGLSYETPKMLDYGFKFQYFYGNKVNEDVLAPYRTDFGQIIGVDYFLTSLSLRERGFFTQIFIGGLIPFGNQGKCRQGFKWTAGLGYIEHKIRIQDDSRAAPQFSGTVGRGHDRLTTGWCTVGFLGYEYKANNGKINFYTGFESVFGFTKNIREWNYDTDVSEFGISRKDILIQYKIAWYLPFFFKSSPESIEY